MSRLTDRKLRDRFLTEPMKTYFSRKFPNDGLLEVKISEFLKYAMLSSRVPGPIPFNEEIDEIWHFWILQTREYQRLCQSLPGGKFVHHSSSDYPGETNDQEPKTLVSFLVSYHNNFGPFTEEVLRYWPTALHLVNELDGDLGAFNSWLKHLGDRHAASKTPL